MNTFICNVAFNDYFLICRFSIHFRFTTSETCPVRMSIVINGLLRFTAVLEIMLIIAKDFIQSSPNPFLPVIL